MKDTVWIVAVGIVLVCCGFFIWSWSAPVKPVQAVVNNYNPYLDGIANVKVTITGSGENESFTSGSLGKAGPFHLHQAYSYIVFVEWQSIRYSRSLTLPEGDIVDLLITIDTESMTVKTCEFLVISQIIDV